MDVVRFGRLIRAMRLERGLTQSALAQQLGLCGKTVSKWERGLGCPDISTLGALSGILGADLARMLSGDLAPNESEVGNMKKSKFYVCPECGSLSICNGNVSLSCCGRTLPPLEATKATPEEALKLELVEDEWFVSSDHPMEKDNYIRFVALLQGERASIVRMYPEWALQTRLPRRGHGMLLWYASDIGLKYKLI